VYEGVWVVVDDFVDPGNAFVPHIDNGLEMVVLEVLSATERRIAFPTIKFVLELAATVVILGRHFV
jgi:hypothetical protein